MTAHGVINAGNFIECVYFRAQTDGILANHLKAAPKNATHLSKTIQNDFIQIVGNTVRNKIISDIKSAIFLADEFEPVRLVRFWPDQIFFNVFTIDDFYRFS